LRSSTDIKSRNQKKTNKRKNNVKNILVFIDNSWGEIEWILPVCHYIKKNYPSVRISLLLNAFDPEKIIKGNEILVKLLSESVHQVYDFRDFLPGIYKWIYKFINRWIYQNPNLNRWKPFVEKYIFGFMKFCVVPRMIDVVHPDVLLKDVEPDIYVRKKIVTTARMKGCREIMFPHASHFATSPKIKQLVRPDLEADDILCNTLETSKIFPPANSIYQNKTHVVGIPKYDY
jgi:hypothetical protein